MNQITGYLDGSGIYGSSHEEEEEVRAGTGGLLNVQGRALLPADPIDTDECDTDERGVPCFKAGRTSRGRHATDNLYLCNFM